MLEVETTGQCGNMPQKVAKTKTIAAILIYGRPSSRQLKLISLLQGYVAGSPS